MDKILNADSLLFRCSSLGYIMIDPKEKSNAEKYAEAVTNLSKLNSDYEAIKNKETKTAANKLAAIEKCKLLIKEIEPVKDERPLADTVKNHLADKYVSAYYGRETDITNKYMRKGLMVEEDSMTLYSLVTNQFFQKNIKKYSNEFICGTPDMLKDEIVIDIKSSWDIFTFYRTNKAKLNKMYYWQLQGYMALTGAKSAKLAYCLVDTPQPLIFQELNNLKYKMGVTDVENDETYATACEEMERLMKYDDVPREEKVNEIIIERNDEDIERLYERIKECRAYMNKHLFKLAA